jgi:uncharacterized protein YpmS
MHEITRIYFLPHRHHHRHVEKCKKNKRKSEEREKKRYFLLVLATSLASFLIQHTVLAVSAQKNERKSNAKEPQQNYSFTIIYSAICNDLAHSLSKCAVKNAREKKSR